MNYKDKKDFESCEVEILKTKIVIFISLIVSLFTLTGCAKTEVQKENYKIVTSFYPMYIIARNITDGANNVQLVNMRSA